MLLVSPRLHPIFDNLSPMCGCYRLSRRKQLVEEYFDCYPVSTRINHVANDDEECSRPAALAEIQNRLF